MKLFPVIAHALLITLPALAQWTYPPSKQVEAADTYFGATYRDPYRWLEELKGADATAWFKAQATLTDDVLAKLPGREALVQEWMALDRLKPAAYRDISCRNGRVFYRKTLAGEDVGKLFFRKGWQGKEELLFDPSTYKPGVTSTLQAILPSFDGRFVAMGISAAGAEVGDVRVLEVATAKLRPDLIEASYGPSSWAPDSRSFCYDFGSHGDPQSVAFHLDRSSKRHVLGTPPAQDLNVLSKEGFPGLGLTPEELPTTWVDPSAPGYVLGGAFTAQSEQRLFVASASSMKAGGPAWRVLCQRTDNLVDTALHGDQVFAISHSGAPRFTVIQTSLEHPDWSRAKTVIPEGQDVIQSITTCKDYLLVVSSNGIVGRVTRYALKTGRLTEVRLPMTGSVGLTCPDPTSNRCLVDRSDHPLRAGCGPADRGQEHLQHGHPLSRLRRPGGRGSRGARRRRNHDPAVHRSPPKPSAGWFLQLHPGGLRLLWHEHHPQLPHPPLRGQPGCGPGLRPRAGRRREG